MCMGKDWGKCTDKRTHLKAAFLCRFSIFYCGCKQLKSIHIQFRVQIYALSFEWPKEKHYFLQRVLIFFERVVNIFWTRRKKF